MPDYFSTSAENEPNGAKSEHLTASVDHKGPLLSRSIEVRQNKTVTLLTGLFAAIIIVLLLGLWFGHFSKSVSVRGAVSLKSGFAKLNAPTSGVVKEILVKQETSVKRGDTIAVLQMSQASSDGKTPSKLEREALEIHRNNLHDDVRRSRHLIEDSRAEQEDTKKNQKAMDAAFESQENIIKNGLNLEEGKLKKLTTLFKQGFATNDTIDGRRRALLQYQRDIAELQSRRIQTNQQNTGRLRQLNAAIQEKEKSIAEIDNEIANIDSRLAELKTKDTLDIIAPNFGNVLTLAVKSNEPVVEGQLLATIGNPDDDPIIVLEAPASAIGLAKTGQSVIIKYDAFPFKTFGVARGVISSISASPIKEGFPGQGDNGGAPLDPREGSKQSLYRVEVVPNEKTMHAYGNDQPIAIGSSLSAEIIVERRRLIDWVLDPIRAMAGRT